MTTTMFVAQFKYREPSLAMITIIKETAKTYQIDEDAVTKLMDGYLYIPSRLHKNKYHLFPTLEEALTWLMEKAEKYAR